MPELKQPYSGRVLVLGGQGVLGTSFRHVNLAKPETLEKALNEGETSSSTPSLTRSWSPN